MGTLVSLNVGMPQDVQWRGNTVHTGIYKSPVDGPRMARRLNIDGDGQGDLGGHGGEQRAVMVYQVESYDYWKSHLGRDDLRPGQFGENFTISGLSDHDVCIGDRYRIGDAEFEVTQPRVTCFRVGMRLDEPDMPNLLVSHHRPGFYLRVITEGYVRAGDAIVRTRRGPHELSVADVDALLYLPGRNLEQLRRIVDVPALSPGWQQSFRDMLAALDDSDRIAPPVGVEPGWRGFRRLRVTSTTPESADVLSIRLDTTDGGALPTPLPGQYLTLKVPAAGDPPPVRNYSLSADPAATGYRISVKRDDHGQVSSWLHANLREGSLLDVAAPRGDFYLGEASTPVALISAGVGITPVLAMLHALATAHSRRDVHWIHTTRNADSHAFAAEVDDLLAELPHAHRHVFYSAADADGVDVVRGRPDSAAIAALNLSADTDAYLCGPEGFMATMREALTAAGIAPGRIHAELFGTLPSINPGIVAAPHPPPHQPSGPPGTGPRITFARSGMTVKWSTEYRSLLELAEACDVPTRYSCRSGVCHTCVTDVLDGTAVYDPPPLEEPAQGSVLVCTAQPDGDLILDL
ncbi:MOSC and FAD-binding oxidoreductase domain-containing protein [Mycolicibacterium sp.]|uniref:MOSC and FAD-binding oxidoreductase domain-containing protein n=1 Tax=Mycolicibacterium sp. TaxID=2320850 RepID=UPI001A1DF171|nr:MOSC and FAD-binding oxidoreductase domain-containing protein [Mycolicibacterium sp.]MBJ7339469.1 MOSC domain-containing protein [Mycolicibacterium sp.]